MQNHTKQVLQWKYITNSLAKYSLSKNQLQIHKIKILKSKTKIEKQLNESREMKQFLQNIQNHIKTPIYDIRPFLKQAKAENSYLLHKELIQIAKTINAGKKIYLYIAPHKTTYPLLFNIASDLYPITNIQKIEYSITQNFDKLGKLQNNASTNLAYIRKHIRQTKYNIENILSKFINKKTTKEILQDHIITLRENRYVIPIKKDFKGRIQGITIDKSNSNETLFIEPFFINTLNNQLINLEREEKLEEINILKEITKQIRNNTKHIYTILKQLSYFDLVYTKGKLAIEMNANMPHINNNRTFKIYSAKHPMLKNNAIPIDIILDKNYNILIITGPNTAGKTLAIKTIGLLSIMALSGMLIPANENSTIPINDHIFIDSGDEQSIEKNLSTFSAHIKRIIHILKYATKKSLVLIDEIGSGTDPEEGSSIAIAIINKLKNIKCKTIITSHYKAIRNYPLNENKKYKTTINASCSINPNTLKPNYKLIYGKAEKSNAINIAKKLGLDNSIIQNAENIIQKQKSEKDKIIDQIQEEKYILENKIQEYQNKINKIQNKEYTLNQQEHKLMLKQNIWKENFIKKELQKIQEIRKNALNLYKNAKTKANNIEKNYIKNNIKIIDNSFNKTKKHYNNIITNIEKLSQTKKNIHNIKNIKKGDEVHIISLNKNGTVSDIKNNEIIIQIKNIKINTPKNNILPIEKQIPQNNISYSVKQDNHYEINITGLNQNEAIYKIQKYIENLNANGTKYARIIHGYGKIRKEIINLLNNNKLIDSFNTANPNQGGFGVTIINIK